MRQIKTFDVYADPQHAWVKVKRKTLGDLGVLNQITAFSYQRNGFVYLEEDCDAGTFIKAYQERFSVKPQFRHHHTNKQSKIRNYWGFRLEMGE